jgi:hypothetical protein
LEPLTLFTLDELVEELDEDEDEDEVEYVE